MGHTGALGLVVVGSYLVVSFSLACPCPFLRVTTAASGPSCPRLLESRAAASCGLMGDQLVRRGLVPLRFRGRRFFSADDSHRWCGPYLCILTQLQRYGRYHCWYDWYGYVVYVAWLGTRAAACGLSRQRRGACLCTVPCASTGS